MLLASEDIKQNVYNLNATVLRKAMFSQVQTLQDSEYKMLILSLVHVFKGFN